MAKRIIAIGKPTRLRAGGGTACGLHGSTHDAAYDPRDVDCLRCRKTKPYKQTIGVSR